MKLSEYRSFLNGLFKQERNQLLHDQKLFLSVEKNNNYKIISKERTKLTLRPVELYLFQS